MPPVDPIRNVQSTTNATNPAGKDPLAARDDRRGGGGAGGGKKNPEPEAESPAENQVEEGPHLEADALSMRGREAIGAGLDFGDEMPWEQQAQAPGGAPKKPAGLARPGTAPLRPNLPSLGKKGTPGAAGRPVAPPSGPGASMARPGPVPQMGPGRQVEVGYDPTAALTQTLSALQGMGKGQVEAEEIEAPSQKPLERGQDPLAALRGRVGQPPSAAHPGLVRGGSQPAEGVEEGPLVAPDAPPDLGFDFSLEELSAPGPLPAPKTRAPVPPPEAPKLEGRGTGSLPLRGAPPASPGLRAASTPSGARPGTAPLPQRKALGHDANEGLGQRPAPAISGPSPALAAPLPALAPAAVAPPAAPTVQEATSPPPPPPAAAPVARAKAPSEVRRPTSLDAPPPAPPPPKEAAALMVRVVDLRSSEPLSGARLELEPVENDRLPTLPGQADSQGWWVVPRISPGLYRLTARHPGKVPTARDLSLQAGELEDIGLVMASP